MPAHEQAVKFWMGLVDSPSFENCSTLTLRYGVIVHRMLLVTKTHHERDETKGPDKVSLQDIGQVKIDHGVIMLNLEVVNGRR